MAYGAPASYGAGITADGLDDCEQIVVKEAWQPVALAAGAGAPRPPGPAPPSLPARRNGVGFVPGEPLGLFVMLRLRGRPSGTDDGWVYGTLAADRATVTASGALAACMGCHASAPKGRLFGLPKSAFERQ